LSERAAKHSFNQHDQGVIKDFFSNELPEDIMPPDDVEQVSQNLNMLYSRLTFLPFLSVDGVISTTPGR
jgi:hypothetical protein